MCLKATTTSSRLGAKNMLLLLLPLIVFPLLFSGCLERTGACVGAGGSILSGPVCKEGWTADECQEWDDMEVNDADWTFHRGVSCEDLGYTEECADGSWRWPGYCD